MPKLGVAPVIHPGALVRNSQLGAYVEIAEGTRVLDTVFGDKGKRGRIPLFLFFLRLPWTTLWFVVQVAAADAFYFLDELFRPTGQAHQGPRHQFDCFTVRQPVDPALYTLRFHAIFSSAFVGWDCMCRARR